MEKRPDPSSTGNKNQDIRIPGIGLQALKYVHYKNVVRLILQTNPSMEFSFSEMVLLWEAIVNRAFHFACACEKEAKRSEVSICHFRGSTET